MQLRVDGHVDHGACPRRAGDRTHHAFRRPNLLSAPVASHYPILGIGRQDRAGSKVLQNWGLWSVNAPLLAQDHRITGRPAARGDLRPMLRAEVLSAQGARIDAISPATYTSAAYLQSLYAAIDKLYAR